MLPIRQRFLPQGHRNRPAYPMVPRGVLFHTTNNWNDGAGDEMHAMYMSTTETAVSWHVTVDKDSATQHIPYNENAWHAGDGRDGEYNRNWIGVEIACEAVDPGQPLDRATYNNAVDVVAQVMMANGLNHISQVQPHAIVYGKDCPHHTLFDREKFRNDVMAMIASRTKPSPPGVTNEMSKEDAEKIIRFLSAAWYAAENAEAKAEFNRLANEVRKAAGIPTQ